MLFVAMYLRVMRASFDKHGLTVADYTLREARRDAHGPCNYLERKFDPNCDETE